MQKMLRAENKSNIAVFKGRAYWLKNNTLFVSELNKDGEIDTRSTKKLDVFSLPDKEMDSLMKIIDTLNN